MIHRIDVTIRTPVNPTEVTDRVVSAVRALFPSAEIDVRDGEVVATAHSLAELTDQFRRREILDAARAELLANRTPDGFRFRLKKQPAFVGVASFAVGKPGELGEIDVDVRVLEPDVETVIDHVAPPSDAVGDERSAA